MTVYGPTDRDDAMEQALDATARILFTRAVRENFAGRLLSCLHNGGCAVMNPNGDIMLLAADQLSGAPDEEEEDGPPAH